jgi:hypothetical protein
MDFSANNFGSQSFGFSQAGASTPSPKKGQQAGDKRETHGVLPMTMQMYLQATAASYSSDHTIDVYGLKASKVSLVGWVQKAEETPTYSEYTVHDKTGVVTVQNYMTHGDKPKEGEVIRVVGTPRDGGVISAINLAVQADNAWVGFHRLQAVVVQCQAGGNAAPAPLDYSPVKAEAPAPAQSGAVKMEPGLSLPDQIKASIKHKLKFGSNNGMGVNIADICEVLRGKTAEPEVRKKIADLCNEGVLFETDENFVNLTEA